MINRCRFDLTPPGSHLPAMPGKAISTPWTDVIVVCRKCGKKRDGGFGDKRKQSLKAVLRQALRESGRRRQIRVMETGCLGICPKDGVTALNATRPGMLRVIATGSNGPAALEALLGGNVVAQRDVVADPDGVEAA